MSLPFTPDEFFGVFGRYNHAVWPAQILLIAIALVILSVVDFTRSPRPSRVPGMLLALLWLWSGAVYHMTFFAQLNRIAWLFGAVFISQAVVLVLAAWRGQLSFRFRPEVPGWTGVALIAYALAVYPFLAHRLGHVWPNTPTFGVPCPLTIFTFGLLSWSAYRPRWYILATPLFWSVVGTSAALNLGVAEDFGLPVAALMSLLVMFGYQSSPRHATI